MSSLSLHSSRAGSHALQCARRLRLVAGQASAQQLGPSTPGCCLCSGHRRMQQALRRRCLHSVHGGSHRSRQLMAAKAASDDATPPVAQHGWLMSDGGMHSQASLEASLQQAALQSQQQPDVWLLLAKQALAVLCATALIASSCFMATPAYALNARQRLQVAMVIVQPSSSLDHASAASRSNTAAHAASPLQTTSMAAQPSAELSSEAEDSLLEALRQVEARVDSALGAVTSSIPGIAGSEAERAINAEATSLINEVWEVVDLNYMDARGTGFDHSKWAALRDAALHQRYHDKGAVYRAVRDMLARGVSDPYCRFITPSEFASMKKYDVTGVGLNLGTAEEYTRKTGRELPPGARGSTSGIWVVGISKGSAADRAGIVQGDQVLEVDGRRLTAVSPFQAASLISGPDAVAGTPSASTVTLRVRKAEGSTEAYTIERPVRVLASPVSAQLQRRAGDRAVGVVRLSSFNARAERDLAAALRRLEAEGATEFELDLRDNRGGLVSEGLEVARLFLEPNSPIVLTESKAMAAEPPRSGPAPPLTTAPLTVMVNEHTASASEILAGALHDNCRAVLVGGRTYGKGLIQSVYELSDSSGLVITVGKYLTPRRTDIDRSGIMPDFRSQPTAEKAAAVLDACRLEAAALSSSRG